MQENTKTLAFQISTELSDRVKATLERHAKYHHKKLTLKEFGIKTCFYGHLHGNAIRFAVQGEVDGIRYKLVSADGLRFCTYRIN